MNTRQLHKELKLDSHLLFLFLQGKTPSIEWEDQSYASLWHLIQQLPILSDPSYIEQFAYISNFFWKAGEFCYIESISDYQNFYKQRIEQEKKCLVDLFEYRLTDYKVFDVSVMHIPRIENNQLVYFTYNATNRVPYRVVCPFPYHLNSTYVHYQVLPILD